MASPFRNLIRSILYRRSLRRWKQVANSADRRDLGSLRRLRQRAMDLRVVLDRLIHIADGRLTLPLIGSDAIQLPLHSDWWHRPEIWRGPVFPMGMSSVESKTMFGSGVSVFHDCRRSELTLRQIRNAREEDLAPFGLRMDVFRFDGSFLSLVIDLPDDAVQGLTRRHLVRLTADIEVEKPLEIFARLNIKHGPNTEQVVREFPLDGSADWVEFDLAYTKLNERRVEKIWLDLIFEGPEMNQVTLRDVTLIRRPRAEL